MEPIDYDLVETGPDERHVLTVCIDQERGSGLYVARCLEIELTSQGTTVAAALKSLADAYALARESESLT